MSVCTYDNPATMSRECWQDGKLLCKYSAVAMEQKNQWPPPPEKFFFGANVGDWNAGQIIGDSAAIGNGAVERALGKV